MGFNQNLHGQFVCNLWFTKICKLSGENAQKTCKNYSSLKEIGTKTVKFLLLSASGG